MKYKSVFLSALIILSSSFSVIAKEELSIKNVPSNFIYVPMARQSTNYTCGVAALQSVLGYYGDEFREGTLATELKPDQNNGTSYHNIINFSKRKGYSAKALYKMNLEQLKKLVDQKKPVIVAIQAWADKPVSYLKDWDDGHYAVVIGYDNKYIYFMDPSTLGNYTYIPVKDFLERWHDTDGKEKLFNFGLLIEKPNPKYNQDKILMMD